MYSKWLFSLLVPAKEQNSAWGNLIIDNGHCGHYSVFDLIWVNRSFE